MNLLPYFRLQLPPLRQLSLFASSAVLPGSPALLPSSSNLLSEYSKYPDQPYTAQLLHPLLPLLAAPLALPAQAPKLAL